MNTKKIITLAYYAIVLVLLVIVLFKVYGGDEIEGAKFGVWQGVVYSGIAVAAAVLLAVIGLITKPKSAISFLIGIAVLAVIFFIGKSLAADTVPLAFEQKNISLETLQNSEAGVWASLIMGGIAVVLAIASGVKSILD
ncbi:MAG: hypothetical protein JJ975_07280 [Bacteroidia bacterium]|nr:hypothetical protein [Bacteroidia bacterium]